MMDINYSVIIESIRYNGGNSEIGKYTATLSNYILVKIADMVTIASNKIEIKYDRINKEMRSIIFYDIENNLGCTHIFNKASSKEIIGGNMEEFIQLCLKEVKKKELELQLRK